MWPFSTIRQLQSENADLAEANANQRQEIARLQIADSKFMTESRTLHNQVEYLVRTIRDMDQEIWNMTQKLDWPAQRPYFIKLQDGMTARKHAENERINDILRPELIKTYRPEEPMLNVPKRIAKT